MKELKRGVSLSSCCGWGVGEGVVAGGYGGDLLNILDFCVTCGACSGAGSGVGDGVSQRRRQSVYRQQCYCFGLAIVFSI